MNINTTAINPQFRNADGSLNFDRLFAAAQNKPDPEKAAVEIEIKPAAVSVSEHLQQSYQKAGVREEDLIKLTPAVKESVDQLVAAVEVQVTVSEGGEAAQPFTLTEMTDEEKGLQATVTLALTTLENLSTLRFVEENEDLIAWVCKIANSNEQVKARATELGIECTVEPDGACKIAFDEVEA